MDVKSFNSKIIDSNFEIVKIRDIIEKPPQYWANERAIDWNPNIDYRYIRITDIDDYWNLKEDERKTSEKIENKYIVNENDLLFARSWATAWKCYFVTKNIKWIFAWYMIRFVLNHKKCISKYLFYITFTNFYKKRVEKISRAAAQPNINSQEYLDFEFPLPPLEIQQQIVEKMDSALAEKKNLENKSNEILNSIDDYVLSELWIELEKQEEKMYFSVDFKDIIENNRFDPSYFTNSFKIKKSDYELKNIYDIAEIKKWQSITQEKIIEWEYPVIAWWQTSPYNHNQKNYDWNVITISASWAYSWYVRYHEKPIFASDCSVVFSKDENVISTFFIYTRLKINQKEIYKMQKWAWQPHVYPDDIWNFTIPLPPREIQDKIINEVKSRIEKAKQLKNQATEIYEQAKDEVEKMILWK